MAQTKVDLMAFGIDSVSAEKILKKYTIQQLKKQTMETLLSLGLSKEVAERLLHSTRPPIPQKIAEEVLLKSAFTCCICRQSDLPVVIHHLERWEQSHSHAPDNLAVLCLNHHGEAHSYHENSRNLTAQIIRKARDQWYACIENQNIEAELALDTVRRYCGRWDYFNLSYIFGFINDRKISFNSRFKSDLIAKGLITENGTICSDKLTKNDAYWLNFFDGLYLKGYIEELLNIIIGHMPVRYIRDSLYMRDRVMPGELLLVDGRFYFKRLNKCTKGIGQTRSVRGTVNRIRFTGEFDAWYCNSSSSHHSHLTGNKHATLLCLVRNVERADASDLVDCTVIGLGLNLTQPDLMAQLMGNERGFSVSDFKSQAVCERELDSIADIQRGQREKKYYISAPDVCDICKITFQNQKYMIDGAMKHNGTGACMCPKCFRLHGTGIGWGIGQLYLRQNNRWLLVGGFCNYEEDEREDEMDEETILQLMDSLFPFAQEQ